MIAAQERANDLLAALLEAMKERRTIPPIPPVEPLEIGKSPLETATFQVTHEVNDRLNPSPKLQLALDWLKEHPGDMEKPTREVAAQLGISHAWVGKARRIIRGEDDQTLP